MTGGMAYLYDPEGQAENVMNLETLVTCPVTVQHWEDQLKGMIERHAAETGSRKANAAKPTGRRDRYLRQRP